MKSSLRQRLLTLFYWVLALEFIVGAVTKYWPGTGPFGQDYAVKFVDWGYPAWFRFVVGTGEFVAAVLLLIASRRSRFLAGGLLVVILVGAVITHVVNRNSIGESIMAPTHLVLSAVIVWINRPKPLSDLWTRWPHEFLALQKGFRTQP
jgi:uncharacterized membrane protein YphA (DoxX/SURF4 family)